MPFLTPVIDRTESDVSFARLNQNSVSDLKGAFNISDANRIIGNTIYLRDLLNNNGYTVSFADQPLFLESDFAFITSKLDLMRDNIIAVVTAFYTQGHPAVTFATTLNFTDVNNMELNLQLTNQLLENMIADLNYCGAITCGDAYNL